MKTALFVLLTLLSFQTLGSELHLGLKTYHVDRSEKSNGCLNENHNLVGGRVGNLLGGTYTNTHCMTSYYLGGVYDLPKGWGLEGVFVSGYPSKLHKVGKLTIIVVPTYTLDNGAFGLKFLIAPHQLVGVGLVVKL